MGNRDGAVFHGRWGSLGTVFPGFFIVPFDK